MSQRRFLVGTYTTERTTSARRAASICARWILPVESTSSTCATCRIRRSWCCIRRCRWRTSSTKRRPATAACRSLRCGDRLEPRQRVDSEGELPCHLALLDARALVVAHYGCGTIGVFELDAARRDRSDAANLAPRRRIGASASPGLCASPLRARWRVGRFPRDRPRPGLRSALRRHRTGRGVALCNPRRCGTAASVSRRNERGRLAEQRARQHRVATHDRI